MRFVVDAQLPPALARYLVDRGHVAEHVRDLGMEAAGDRRIWRYAERAGAVIVSKDEDFVSIQASLQTGPAVVWIRVGNATRRALLEWLGPLMPAIERALEAGERLIEVT